MKIAYTHLVSRIESKPDINELSDKLFQLGHEHEIENNIFDMEFTPNRGDCLSINGILRDLAVFYKINLDQPIYNKILNELDLDFCNHAIDACPQISFLKIEIKGKISTYSGVLSDYFNDLQLNRNNFFTDVSNYISYEMGQPTHCYDFNKIKGKLTLKKINNNAEFESLLGKEVHLTGNNLVFFDNDEIINLAGLVGGKSTSCSIDTNTVLVECAYFNPEVIMGKAVKYGIQSEAAHKFERNVDSGMQKKVLQRFLRIIDEHVEIKSVQYFSETYKPSKETLIPLNLTKIKKILGVDITEKRCKDILKELNFNFSNSHISVPSYRSDVKTQNDLAEEVARVIGYDNINPKEIQIPKTSSNIIANVESSLKNLLTENGFYEVINNPFTPDKNLNAIMVDNPLDSNRGFLRTELKQSLINNLLYNERRQKDSIKLFEISDVYSFDNDVHKKRVIGIIASGRAGKNYRDFSKKITTEYLSGLFKHNGITANLNFVNISRQELNTKLKTPIIYLEIDIDNLPDNFISNKITPQIDKQFAIYEPISEFPSSVRDLSFSTKDTNAIKKLILFIESYTNTMLKEKFIFDFFENKKTGEIKIGYRFVLQSKSSTLKDSEVDGVISSIISNALTINGLNLPGYSD
jgi:phenylalanyl-tRNA synthetase beta chain